MFPSLSSGVDGPSFSERTPRIVPISPGRTKRSGVPGRAGQRWTRWTRIEDQALRQAYADGLSCAEISSSLSSLHSVGSVAARARKLGLTSYARRWTREE